MIKITLSFMYLRNFFNSYLKNFLIKIKLYIMKKIVFLCGPIRDLSREESLGWREKAGKILSKSFITIHALRNREIKETLPDPKIAIARDKNDIIKSDIILVNDSFRNASMIGTAMEVFFSYEMYKPIIVFGNAHIKDYWLNYHSHARVETLEEACAIINNFFA
ncbi:MAG: hypothetical protein V1732_06320 [Patescibacteria group bacterium]